MSNSDNTIWVYNTKTRKPEPLAPEAAQKAVADGSHTFLQGSTVSMVAPDGTAYDVPANSAQQAIVGHGWQLESPEDSRRRDYLKENEGLKGDLKVGGGQFLNQATFGAAEPLVEGLSDDRDVKDWEALKERHPISNVVGGAAGLGTSLLYGGPLFDAAGAAGRGAEAALGGESLAGQILGRGANLATQGAVSYLYNALPKPSGPPTPFTKQVKWEPSDQEMAAFKQKAQVVVDPMSVFGEVAKGTLTKNHAEALQAVFPSMKDSMSQAVMQAGVTDKKLTLSYTKRAKLAMLLGSQLDSSLAPARIVALQSAYAPADGGGGNKPHKMKVDNLPGMSSQVQDISTGTRRK